MGEYYRSDWAEFDHPVWKLNLRKVHRDLELVPRKTPLGSCDPLKEIWDKCPNVCCATCSCVFFIRTSKQAVSPISNQSDWLWWTNSKQKWRHFSPQSHFILNSSRFGHNSQTRWVSDILWFERKPHQPGATWPRRQASAICQIILFSKILLVLCIESSERWPSLANLQQCLWSEQHLHTTHASCFCRFDPLSTCPARLVCCTSLSVLLGSFPLPSQSDLLSNVEESQEDFPPKVPGCICRVSKCGASLPRTWRMSCGFTRLIGVQPAWNDKVVECRSLGCVVMLSEWRRDGATDSGIFLESSRAAWYDSHHSETVICDRLNPWFIYISLFQPSSFVWNWKGFKLICNQFRNIAKPTEAAQKWSCGRRDKTATPITTDHLVFQFHIGLKSTSSGTRPSINNTKPKCELDAKEISIYFTCSYVCLSKPWYICVPQDHILQH